MATNSRGAEFGPQATELSAPQGAGANPVAGVETPASAIDLRPISTLVEGFGSMFKDMAKKKSEANDAQILSDFANDLGNLDQKVLQDGNSNAYMAQRSVLISKYRARAPSLTGDFQKMLNLGKEGAGGVAEDEETATRRRRQMGLDEAFKAGIPIPKERAAQDDVLMAMQTSNRVAAQTKEYREAAKFEQEQAGWVRTAAAERRKDQAKGLLVEYAGAHAIAFNSVLFDLVGQVNSGTLKEEDAMSLATSHYTKIQGEIATIAIEDRDAAAPFKSMFDNIFNTAKEGFKPGSNLENLKRQMEQLKVGSWVQTVGKNPKLLQLSTLSETFKGNPTLFASIDPVLSASLIEAGIVEDGRMTPKQGEGKTQIIGNDEFEKQSYSVVLGGIKDLTSGNLPAERQPAVKREVFGMLREVTSQFTDAYQLNKLTPESRRKMSEFLLDSSTAKFLKENPLPNDVARGLVSVAEDNFKQFERTFREQTSDLLRKAAPPVEVGYQTLPDGTVVHGPYLEPIRSASQDPIDAIDISWNGSQIVFTPKNVPVDRYDQNKLMSNLDKVSRALSNGVIISAHIKGTDDYKKHFEEIKWKLFPSKFEAPPQKNERKAAPTAPVAPAGVKRNKAEEAMARDAAELFTPSAPDGNEGVRIQSDLDSIRSELKRHKKGSPTYNALLEEFANVVEGR